MVCDKVRIHLLNFACGLTDKLNVADNRILRFVVQQQGFKSLKRIEVAGARSMASAMCSK